MIGQLNERVHLQVRITDMVDGYGRFAVAGVVKAGAEVFGAPPTSASWPCHAYLLADMRASAWASTALPNSRRPRGTLIGEEVVAKFGNYMTGNVLTYVIAGAATFVWRIAFDIPSRCCSA